MVPYFDVYDKKLAEKMMPMLSRLETLTPNKQVPIKFGAIKKHL